MTSTASRTWPNAGPNVYGIGGDFVFRLYLADISYDGTDHLLAVAVGGTDAAALRSFLPTAKQVIASADAPIEASQGRWERSRAPNGPAA